MPMSPPSLCTAPDCGTLVYGGGRCPACRTQSRREAAARRPNAYDAQWARFAKRYLRNHPTCECTECLALPEWRRPAATDVDHIDGQGPEGPHGYDEQNLCAMSHAHHSRKTATQDGGFGRVRRQTDDE
jgi:hypothetical protein